MLCFLCVCCWIFGCVKFWGYTIRSRHLVQYLSKNYLAVFHIASPLEVDPIPLTPSSKLVLQLHCKKGLCRSLAEDRPKAVRRQSEGRAESNLKLGWPRNSFAVALVLTDSLTH